MRTVRGTPAGPGGPQPIQKTIWRFGRGPLHNGQGGILINGCQTEVQLRVQVQVQGKEHMQADAASD